MEQLLTFLPTYLFALVALLLLYVYRQESRDNRQERQEMINMYQGEMDKLMDRIQAPSFDEYKVHQEEPEEKEEEVTQVDLDEVREELVTGDEVNNG